MDEQVNSGNLAEMEIVQFPGKIISVNSEKKADAVLSELLKERMVGIDTETRPSFKKGVTHHVALVQIATWDTCYLFRVCRMHDIDAVKQILESPRILKIGLSLKNDFIGLRRKWPVEPHNYIDLQQYVATFGIEEKSLQKIYALLFGKRISKTKQLSNWEVPRLTVSQRNYAAIDAWACLHIYKALLKKPLPKPYQSLLPITYRRGSEKLFIQK